MSTIFKRFPSYRNFKVNLHDIEENLRTLCPEAQHLENLKASVGLARRESDFDHIDIETFKRVFGFHFSSEDENTKTRAGFSGRLLTRFTESPDQVLFGVVAGSLNQSAQLAKLGSDI
ncbi:hypothetical protein GUITHDRAFT_141369 [Guillardia theta CCMP2712]|uniref:Uncharacterized protein n=1 Tax=Guillardia theta (strain CCMP2712) TaxID=905079 RepID=L1J1Y8_GUITC|nr:hypothetical protein GUITHDRAFT_141369 [Guillardia theta CCMP2712]EKX42154.1 hypothetical protein GUITHDRAFT_141369 [Guillardia theta CCMP2712]|eukprot:XP_005829134.1 hypothetical protein GUITHDRAFT_141369 [Guillardia theta CCMP2712]